jgi:hypothetical protein
MTVSPYEVLGSLTAQIGAVTGETPLVTEVTAPAATIVNRTPVVTPRAAES